MNMQKGKEGPCKGIEEHGEHQGGNGEQCSTILDNHEGWPIETQTDCIQQVLFKTDCTGSFDTLHYP